MNEHGNADEVVLENVSPWDVREERVQAWRADFFAVIRRRRARRTHRREPPAAQLRLRQLRRCVRKIFKLVLGSGFVGERSQLIVGFDFGFCVELSAGRVPAAD
jgi:hypothetical protein